MAKKNVWTVPMEGGGWGNKLEGSSRFINKASTKQEAQKLGRERAQRDKVEHIVQKKDGAVGTRTSYAGDSRRARG